MREGFEGEMTATNIELGVITTDKKFRILTAAEVADYLAEAS
jgi:20S proteasome subunit alpha 2